MPQNKPKLSVYTLADQVALLYEILARPGMLKPSYAWALYGGLYLIFATVITLPAIFFAKGEVVLLFTGLQHPALNFLFRYVTYFGDGVCFALVALGMCWYRRSFILPFLIVGGTHFLLVLLGKALFPELSRPLYHLSSELLPPLSESILLYKQHSFPSGHTATAFSWVTLTCLLVPKRRLFFPLLFVLVLVPISRLYFLQAFYIDIVAGALIGVATALLGWVVYSLKRQTV